MFQSLTPHVLIISIRFPSKRYLSSTSTEIPKKQKFGYIKYTVLALGSTSTATFAYQVYKWIVQVPICPNFHRLQTINIDNPLACTALLRNVDKQCSGNESMKKIGAATGRNIFDAKYTIDYFETLADLLLKLDEKRILRLLSNLIGYYIFICPECHSSITRQMISCASYLNQAGLQSNPANISEILLEQNNK